jgi:peptidyl-prolyl cis-trans isomerase D
MLNVFRENLRSLKWVLLLVVASFILAIFAVWGGGIGRSDDAPGIDQAWAARVDGDTIGLEAFRQEARNLDAAYRQILGSAYNQQRAFLRVGQAAVNNLVDRELLSREARAMGLTVSDEELAEAILRDPAFQENGVFIGRERYERMYRSNQAGLQAYEQRMAQGLLLEKLRSLIQDSVSVGEAELRDAYARQNEKIQVEYILFESSTLPAPQPNEAQLEGYYRDHRDSYPSGEARSGEYVLLDLKDLAAGIEVPEAEIRSQYLQDLKTLFTVPEKRRASHILVKLPADADPAAARAAEGKARSALERLRKGGDFEAVAREVSEDSSAPQGGDLGYFTRDQMVPEFSTAVWSMNVGDVSEPVRSSFGIHVIRLTDIQPGREMSLDEARPQILTRLRAARAQEEARRRAGALAARAREGKGDLAGAAKAMGMVAHPFAEFHRGDELPGLGRQPFLEEQIFALKPGEVSEPVSVAAGLVVARFAAGSPGGPLPFERVRDRVARDLADQMRVEEARRRLDAAGGPSNLQAAARRLKLDLRTAGPLARVESIPEVGSDAKLMERLFAMRPGETAGPVSVPAGVAVFRLVSRTDPMQEFETRRDAFRSSLVAAKQDRLFRAVLERLRAEHRVEINTALVEDVDRS